MTQLIFPILRISQRRLPNYLWSLSAMLILLWGRNISADSGVLILHPHSSVDYSPYLEYWQEDSSIAEKWDFSRARRQEFRPVPNGKPDFGFVDSPIWFRLSYSYPESRMGTQENYSLVMDHPLLDYVDFYADFDDSKPSLLSGDRRYFENRSVEHRKINWTLPDRKGEEGVYRIYFRIQTSSSFQAGGEILSTRSYQDAILTENIALGLYYGAMIALLIYNFLIFVFLKDFLYLVYSAYLGFFLVFQMALSGTLFGILLPNQPVLCNHLTLIGLTQALFWASLFNILFLQLKIRKFLLNSFYFLMIAYGVLTLLSLFLPYNIVIRISSLLAVAFPILTMVAGLLRFRDGYKPAKYFLIAWSLYLITVMVFGLKTMGVIPAHWFFNYILQIGSLLEASLLSLALAYKFNLIRLENQDSNARLQSYSDQLEEMVKHRTQELEDSVESLEEAQKNLIETEKKSSLTQLAAGLAHELNNPINYIAAGIPNIKKETDRIENVFWEVLDFDNSEESLTYGNQIRNRFHSFRSILKRLEHSTKRAEGIIREIRGLTEVDGSIYTKFSMKEMVKQEIITARRNLLEEGISGKIKIFLRFNRRSDIYCLGNPFSIGRILRNTLMYAMARSYKAEEPKMRVEIQWKGNYGSIVISYLRTSPPNHSSLSDLDDDLSHDIDSDPDLDPGIKIAQSICQNMGADLAFSEPANDSDWVSLRLVLPNSQQSISNL